MEEKYLKEIKITEQTELEKEHELIKNIILTSNELNIANNNYNFAQGDLVDYYAYQIKANQSKLDYLIKLAKKQGIAVDSISKMRPRFQNLENSEAV